MIAISFFLFFRFYCKNEIKNRTSDREFVVSGLGEENTESNEEEMKKKKNDNDVIQIFFDNCSFISCLTFRPKHDILDPKFAPGNNRQKEIMNYEFDFKFCLWRDNRALLSNHEEGNGGAFQYGMLSSSSAIKSTFSFFKCDFFHNIAIGNGGAIAVKSSGPFVLDHCLFKENKAGFLEEKNQNQNQNQNQNKNKNKKNNYFKYGGAIYIDPTIKLDDRNFLYMPNIEISSCIFSENIALNGNAIFVEQSKNTIINLNEGNAFTDNGNSRYDIVCYSPNLNLNSQVVFNETVIKDVESSLLSTSKEIQSTSSPIYMLANTDYLLENMLLENKQGSGNGSGNAVDIGENFNSATIRNCIFSNCGRNGFVIKVSSQPFHFINNTIIFTNSAESCKGMAINIKGEVLIDGCLFRNCNCADHIDGGAGFIYLPTITGGEEKFTLINTEFYSMIGVNKTCFNLNIMGDKFETQSVTIRDCNIESYLFYINFNDAVTKFEATNWSFIGIKSSSKAGGSPFLIVTNRLYFSLELLECNWTQNQALNSDSGSGGAFQSAYSKTNLNIDLTFQSCFFGSNIANKEGGALAIQSCSKISVIDCTFIKNKATDGKGGAIVIDPDYNSLEHAVIESALISNCIFKGNQAIDAYAIYMKSGLSTNSTIIDCIFKENISGNNIIYSEFSQLFCINCLFSFDSIFASSRAIYLGQMSNTEIDGCTFIKCAVGGDGSAVRVNATAKRVQIKNSIFKDCGNSGFVVSFYASPVLLKNNTFDFTSKDLSGGGVNIQTGGEIEISDCSFIRTNQVGALTVISNDRNESIYVSGNIFKECYGSSIRCFNFNTVKPFFFSNNTITNCQIGNYLGNIDFKENLNEDDELIFNECKWINCQANSRFGGGSGLFLANGRVGFKVSFIQCEFKNNYQTNDGGAFQCGTYVFNIELKFEMCSFIENKAEKNGGALSIETIVPFVIDNCTFKSNQAKNCGGAVFINDDDDIFETTLTNLIITNSLFFSNSGKNGTTLYIYKSYNTSMIIENCNKFTNYGETGSMIVSKCSYLIIMNIEFDFFFNQEKAGPNFRALFLLNNSGTTINNCSFRNNGFTASKENGTAIQSFESKYINIENCEFTDCGTSLFPSSYTISSLGQSLYFENSSIKYTNISASCGGISLHYSCSVKLINSNIKNCYVNNSFGGGFQYGLYGIKFNDDIVIEGCTFDNCQSGVGRAIYGVFTQAIVFNNNTIKNMEDGTYILAFSYSEYNGPVIFDNIRFENNKCNESDGGGIGLWFLQPTKLTMKNCQFIGNTLTNKKANGGVLGYSSSIVTKEIELEFDSCLFEDNNVQPNCNGSALYIETHQKPTLINDCEFRSTEASASYGGAIYIHAESNYITISGCKFSGIKSKNEGNALFIGNGTQCVTIIDTIFFDCGNKSFVIFSSSRELNFLNSTITFSEVKYGSSCSAIDIIIQSVINVRDSLIKNCYSQRDGSALLYLKISNAFFRESIVFENSTFDNCQGSMNGIVFFGKSTVPATFRKLTIQNIINKENYIFVWAHDKTLDKVILENCNFINLNSNSPDATGGGLGLWLSQTKEIEFNGCNFINLTSGYNGGAISFELHNSIKIIKLLFNNCFFDKNSAGDNYNGSALYFDIYEPVSILNCTFSNNHISRNGGAIYVTKNCKEVIIENTRFISNGNALFLENELNSVSIDQCEFIDCGTNGSVIYSNAKQTIILHSLIDSTSIEKSSKGVYCTSLKFTVSDSTFKRCYNNGKGGAIFLEGLTTSSEESITIENCIFDDNKSPVGCAIILYINSIPLLKGLTIKNNKDCVYSVFISYKKNIVSETRFDHSIFENNLRMQDNIHISNDGGGCGIWVSCLYNHIIFNNCSFKSNRASSSCGGAFAYGDTEEHANTYLSFNQCKFYNNSSGKDGGALFIKTSSPCSIEGSTFISNYDNNNTQFSANAISITKNQRTIISDTVFINNGFDGNSISFNGKEIEFDTVIIKYSKQTGDINPHESNVRGLFICQISIVTIRNSSFINCSPKDINYPFGGGILYKDLSGLESQFNILLSNCTFDNNYAKYGNSLYIDSSKAFPKIKECIFINHQNFTNSIISIFLPYQNEYQFILENCIFRNNKQDPENGNEIKSGGAGIYIEFANDYYTHNISPEIILDECIFENNSSPFKGGAIEYEANNNVLLVKFDHCSFDSNECDGNEGGGALWLTNNAYINSCIFTNNFVERKEFEENLNERRGGAICFDGSGIINIINTRFENNSGADEANSLFVSNMIQKIEITSCIFQEKYGTSRSTISSYSPELYLINSTFIFQMDIKYYQSAIFYGVYIPKCTLAKIKEVSFDCDTLFEPLMSTHICIFINNNIENDSPIETSNDIEICQCTFEGFVLNNTNAKLIKLFSKVNIIFNNNTFRNCSYVSSLILINKNVNLAITIERFDVEEMNFENNIFCSDSKENNNVIIEVKNYNSSFYSTINFIDCSWINNRALSKISSGGAFSMVTDSGNKIEEMYKKICFKSCVFNNNSATNFGAAIYFDLQKDIVYNVLIKNCIFSMNKASNKGGAINIRSSSKEGMFIKIENTQFINNISGGIFISLGKNKELRGINDNRDDGISMGKLLKIQNKIGIKSMESYLLIRNCVFSKNKGKSIEFNFL